MADIDFAARTSFHVDEDIMEVDFSDVTFEYSRTVNAFYDHLDAAARETGRKWFFLVNYLNTKIMAEAWIAFHYRGKLLNLSYSLGSVRFSADDETRAAILVRSEAEEFDPNLFASRKAAVAHLRKLRGAMTDAAFSRVVKLPREAEDPGFAKRVTFHPGLKIMEVDFSNVTFNSARTVDAAYDAIEDRLETTGSKWYFVVNYKNCEILPDAWVAFANRGKRLNLARSLGSVRYAAPDETADAIYADSRKEGFDPSLFDSREGALAMIAEMRDSQRD